MGNKLCRRKKDLKNLISKQRIKYDLDPILEKLLPIYWIMGPRASGKTTQANMLANYIGGAIISVMQLIDTATEAKNDRGILIRQYLHKDFSIPDELVLDILEEEMLRAIKENPKIKAFIIDDFPSLLTQADLFCKEIYRPYLILVLTTKFPVILERLNKSNLEITGAMVQKNLPLYRLNLKSLRTTFGNKMELINGNNPPEEVFQCILRVLRERNTVDVEYVYPEGEIGQNALQGS